MQWDAMKDNPLLISNYDLLDKIGILDYVETIRAKNRELEELLGEAYNIINKASVDELVEFIIKCLSEKFIPSTLMLILNEGIMFNRIKILTYKNMKSVKNRVEIDSLEPYEKFFRKYLGTTSFYIFDDEIDNERLISPFRSLDPEIVVPISGLSGLYGIILFGPKVLGEEYTAGEIGYIDRLMKFTSIGIQNNIHYEHSVKDPKTGLYNHSFFVNRVNEELARSRRNGRPFSVIVMDIDKFKFFNDTYGHLAGDEVIHHLARALKIHMRDEDILSRFGGEEFTVLLPDSDGDAAWNAAERIRQRVESLETPYQDRILKVTVSLGIATYTCCEDLNEEDLLKRADTALYRSKKNGRNRSSAFDSGLLQRARRLSLS